MDTAIMVKHDTRAVVNLVLDGLTSEHSKRAYEKALTDFLAWHAEQGRPALTKALVQRRIPSHIIAPKAVRSLE